MTRAPWRTLDGFGVLGSPPAEAEPIGDDFAGVGDALHPPGFYGPPDALESGQRAGARRRRWRGPTMAPSPFDPARSPSRRRSTCAVAAAGRADRAFDRRADLRLGSPARLALRRPKALAALHARRRRSPRCLCRAQPRAADVVASQRDMDAALSDPPRLCRDRRRHGRRDVETGARRADPGAGQRDLGRTRRAGRGRSGPRRTRLLSADLLADRRQRARSRRPRRAPASPPT